MSLDSTLSAIQTQDPELWNIIKDHHDILISDEEKYRYIQGLIREWTHPDDIQTLKIKNELAVTTSDFDGVPKRGLWYEPAFIGTEICNLEQQIGQYDHFVDYLLVDKETLENYAQVVGVSSDGDEVTVARRIKEAAPCSWINEVQEWAKTTDLAYYLNLYVTNKMMSAYKILRDGGEGDEYDDAVELAEGVNRAVYESPRPDKPFKVLRGQRPLYGVGEIISFGPPRSSTFSANDVDHYITPGKTPGQYVVEIFIPRGAIVSYHPSEDQVIFPMGAQFFVCSKPQIREFNTRGSDSPDKYRVYQMIYVNCPAYPVSFKDVSDNSIKPDNSELLIDTYFQAWFNKLFPFTHRDMIIDYLTKIDGITKELAADYYERKIWSLEQISKIHPLLVWIKNGIYWRAHTAAPLTDISEIQLIEDILRQRLSGLTYELNFQDNIIQLSTTYLITDILPRLSEFIVSQFYQNESRFRGMLAIDKDRYPARILQIN